MLGQDKNLMSVANGHLGTLAQGRNRHRCPYKRDPRVILRGLGGPHNQTAREQEKGPYGDRITR
jgi:hypothetical protein